MNRSIDRQSGFTMIELMSVMFIGLILVALSAPLVKNYAKGSAAGSLHAQFSDALASARQTAVATGQTVAVCASRDGLSCAPEEWSAGWLVYVERALIPQGQAIPADAILDSHQIDDKDFHLVILDEQYQAVSAVRFNSQGFSMAESRLAATMCMQQLSKSMDSVLVERTGRIRVSANPFDRQIAQDVTGQIQSAELSHLASCQSA